jgi:2-dehydropantoate 2-reductase
LRIAIIGTGAMGSVHAGLLAAKGLEVWAIDTRAEHIDAIRRDGLRVSGASGERVVRLPATTEPREAAPADLVVIATKAGDVAAAAHTARRILARDGTVLTIQNGLGAAERVAAAVGTAPLLVGVAGGFGASLAAPAMCTTMAGSSCAWASTAAASPRARSRLERSGTEPAFASSSVRTSTG